MRGYTLPIAVLAILLPALNSTARSQEAPVWAAEYAWNRAYVSGGTAGVLGAESPLSVVTGPDGRAYTHAQQGAALRTGAVRFTERSSHEAVVRLTTADTAVVYGRRVVAGDESGRRFGQIWEFTDTWVRSAGEGGWLLASSQATLLANGADAAVVPLWRNEGNWLERHEGFAAQAKRGGIDLLFLGDSITDLWRSRGKAVWDREYGPLRAANFGISGDRTQHVLWRIEHGELSRIRPRVVVLMIGTNNLGLEHDGLTPRNSPAEAAEGVTAVVNRLLVALPETQILLLGIFPRSHLPGDPLRAQVAETNRRIAELGHRERVRYLDIGAAFLGPDGVLSPEIMPDYLHPSLKGYGIWADAIRRPLTEMLSR